MKLARLYSLLMVVVLMPGCASPQNEGDFQSKSQEITTAFTMHDNRILVPLVINGKGPFTFIFDTGGGRTNTLTPEAANRLRLVLKKGKDETGVGDNSVPAWATRVDRYSIGDLTLLNQEFEILDLRAIQKAFLFPHLDGIIGFGVFDRSVACIDFEKQDLTLKNGNADCFGSSGTTLSFKLQGSHPVISGAINGQAAEFLIDTGDRSALSVCQKFAVQSGIGDEFKGKPEVVSGMGVGGPVPARFATLHDIRIGSEIHMTNVLSRLPLNKGGMFAKSDLSGSVGNEILRRFNIAIDYARHEITLVKNDHFNEPYKFIPPALK